MGSLDKSFALVLVLVFLTASYIIIDKPVSGSSSVVENSTMLISSILLSSASSVHQSSNQMLVAPISTAPSQNYRPESMGSSYLGGDLDDWGYSIKLTSGNGLILAGTSKSYSAGGSDMWLIKMAPTTYTMSNGVTGAYQKEQWSNSYGGIKDDGASAVIQTIDGGFAVAGFTSSFGAGGLDMWLVKTGPDGVMQWNEVYGGSGNDSANCLIQTSDGGYLLAGFTSSRGQSQTSWVVKTDATGKVEWNKMLSGDAATSVIETNEGTYALAIEYFDAFGLVTIDSSGNILLNQIYAAPGDQASAQAIVLGVDGGYSIAGWITDSNTGSNATWMVKTDAVGKQQWSKTYNGLGGYALIKTVEGGYALTGDRAFLIITDALGNVEWNKVYDGQTGNGTQYFTRMQSIIEDSPDHFVMVGFHNSLNWPTSGPYTHWQLNWMQVALISGTQTIPPQITILSPTATTYSERNIPLTFYVNEPSSFLMYQANGLSNITTVGNKTLTNLPNGAYTLTVYATDAYYNTASQTISFNVNSSEPYVPPQVTIKSPTNQTYYKSQPILDFTVNQPVFWTAYSIDGGANNTVISSKMLNSLTNGTHSVTLYAGDIAGGETGYATVNFNVFASAQATPYRLPNMPTDHGYANPVNQFIGEAVALYLYPLFLLIAAIMFAIAVGVIIAVLLIERKTAREKKSTKYGGL